MFIVDGQVHIWSANTPERPWGKGEHPHREPPLEADEVIQKMDAAGVSRAILIPTSLDGYRDDLALAAARRYPERFAVMSRFDIDAPGAHELLANWRSTPGMLGLRYSFARPDVGVPLAEGRMEWIWDGAEKAGLPVMMMVTPAQLHLVDGIAERHPQLKLIMDHLALPGGKKDEEAFAHLDRLLALARHPNVAAKASALPSFTRDSYPYRKLHPYLRRVYDAFGPRRMFWGTDLARLPCSYRQAVTLFTEEIPWLTAADQEWIMGRGLCEWIGWKLPNS